MAVISQKEEKILEKFMVEGWEICLEMSLEKTRKSNIAGKIRISGETSDKGGKFFFGVGLSEVSFFS
ncbi:hypothetical protein ACP6PL_25120 [Dapis sp. BLCC M126]|uniref:hypothetical protein n=1 Tax=Dapis sp. BLCC M126 TaxID=3400189 RepID=UPI003CF7D88E